MHGITRQEAIQSIINCDKIYLTPSDVATVLNSDPHTIRCTARQRPELLGFEFIFSGNRMKIPRIPFLRYIGIDLGLRPSNEEPKELHSLFEHSPMTNEELLIAIAKEMHLFRQEINERLDNIEGQAQDLNNILQSAKNFIDTLSSVIVADK